jgi:hypothetical protein
MMIPIASTGQDCTPARMTFLVFRSAVCHHRIAPASGILNKAMPKKESAISRLNAQLVLGRLKGQISRLNTLEEKSCFSG